MTKPKVKVDVNGPKQSTVPHKNLNELTEDVENLQSSVDRHGEERPLLTIENIGYMMFDEVLRKPIWWNGENWVDAIGNPIDTVYQIVEEDN